MKFTSKFTNLFFFSLIVTCISCKTKNALEAEDVVYYYPDKNVYYDSARSKYYYSLDGAKTWDSMPFSAPVFGVGLGPGIAIERSGDTIWTNNASHRIKYNGVLINVINNRTIAYLKAYRVSKLKAVVKTETQPVEVEKVEPAPEKGLKKFFHKVFGKKKKPEEKKEEKLEEKPKEKKQ